MATTFTTVTDWMGNLDPEREHGGRQPPGLLLPAGDGNEYIRDTITVSLFRLGTGLTAYTPRIGELAQGDTITFTNGSDTLSGNSSDKYECVDNNMIPEPQRSGIWREEIVWRYQGAWEEVPTSTDSRT